MWVWNSYSVPREKAGDLESADILWKLSSTTNNSSVAQGAQWSSTPFIKVLLEICTHTSWLAIRNKLPNMCWQHLEQCGA